MPARDGFPTFWIGFDRGHNATFNISRRVPVLGRRVCLTMFGAWKKSSIC
jgi:hypothetical protein